jgi:hypothetical protein
VDSLGEIDAVVRNAFEDMALLIGAAAALHHLDDRLVCTLVRRLGRVRERALDRLTQIGGRAEKGPSSEWPRPLHPAVESFLLRAQCGRKEVSRVK